MTRIVVTFEADQPAALIADIKEFLDAAETVYRGERPIAELSPEVLPLTGTATVTEEGVTVEPAAPVAEKPKRGRKPKAEKAEKAVEPPAAAPAEPKAVDLSPQTDRDKLREIGSRHMSVFGVGQTVALLKQFGANKLSELPEDKYDEVYKAFAADLERDTAKGLDWKDDE